MSPSSATRLNKPLRHLGEPVPLWSCDKKSLAHGLVAAMSPYIVLTIGVIFLVPTLLPLFPVDWWWVRIWDFPRAQLVVLYLVTIALLLIVPGGGWTRTVNAGVLAICLGYQLSWIVAYLPLAPVQTLQATRADPDVSLKILIANVLMTNRAADRFLAVVNKADPDLLIIDEPDSWWEEQLRVLDDTYPHHTKYPLDNTYGMIVYSRLPMLRSEVKFLVDAEIPSVHSLVRLRSGDVIEVMAVHPRPPLPQIDTAERDAELVLVGRQAKASPRATIVAGDLNDVGWSKTTHLFQQVSGLLDPRRGRGLYPTYHADFPFLRYPLDHLFHSAEFRVRRIAVLDYFGSDHFPLLVELGYEPERTREHHIPQPDEATHERAQEKLERVGEER
jgi:endonuclease/exonuclease/phosphatase (EEP) superfamily protein YafD